jgi:hypothetical protein
MFACHRRCTQQALQLARLLSHSYASTIQSAKVEELPGAVSVEALRGRLAEGAPAVPNIVHVLCERQLSVQYATI